MPDAELAAAVRFLEFLALTEDPVLRALRLAPPDDEPVTDADLTAFDEGMEAVKAGRVMSMEEARRQIFGEP
ncbi:MAG TPA: hypothetical protein VMU89_17200 [Thermomicrobiaceae bacterium]|nr:hypothetical protein [Thermomicrobiaceae bacterium]